MLDIILSFKNLLRLNFWPKMWSIVENVPCALEWVFCCFWMECSVYRRRQWQPTPVLLPWKIPWTEEPGRLQFMGSLRVRHNWATSLSLSHIGEGNGNPLQCSCLENPRDWGAWWAAIYGVAQSRRRLKRLSSSSSVYIAIKSIWYNVWFNVCVSLLIFFLDDMLSIVVRGMLKFSTIIMLLSVPLFMTVSICLTYWDAHMLSVYIHLQLLYLLIG